MVSRGLWWCCCDRDESVLPSLRSINKARSSTVCLTRHCTPKLTHRNWPIDLIELHAAISLPAAPTDIDTSPKGTPTATPSAAKPLRLVLHLTGAPSDKLIVPKGIEACKTQFVNQVKEADFVRWGNTKRVTSLRRGDLEAGWDGVVGGDFDLHQRMASRIVPLPIPLPPGGSTISSGGGGGGGGSGLPSRPPSVEPGQNSSAANSGAKLESAYAARSLPLKIYLPDNAPAMQHVVAPISAETGKPTTLLQMLRTHLPQLFPAVAKPYVLAQPLAQGIVLPPDAEVAWLAACMSGADGWLRVGIRLVAE